MAATSTERLRATVLVAAAAVLSGCAAVDVDRAVDETNRAVPSFTGGQLALGRSVERQRAREQRSAALLAKPLAMDDAVQLALANSPEVQGLIAQSWSELAAAEQAGRIANPLFTFERNRIGGELEIGRLLSLGLLDLVTWPQRRAIASDSAAQAKTQLALRIVEHVARVRQAWVRAVAAQESLVYAEQVNRAAEASAELARRMQQVGNFTKLQRARQHAFYADAAARLASASHAATAMREELVRQLGLTPDQAAQLKLPDRLPELPAQPRSPEEVNAAASQQRLDVQLARQQLDVAGKAQGLNLLNTLVDTEIGARHDTVFDNGTRANRNGWEAAVRLPLFDLGGAQRAAMNAQTLAAANRLESLSRAASSQLRESYSAYRTAYDIAKHYRDEIVPLRKTISEENQLRYNGMIIGVFELLADTRDQIATVMAAIDAQQQFWLADSALASTLVGKPVLTAPGAAPARAATTGADAH